ncbi:Hypothetical protein, putative [Bodo saltans]|uniref:Uncharacterized protein n=1 Tax=Bodo saltans TaxID=75058 RepID=A0A0S4J163_BODSA|nr:Hypothetical protein, putative [Bodo saltans]|eukprot:CUG79937.1 Hypothetical protein, putative [Bodo saltans]
MHFEPLKNAAHTKTAAASSNNDSAAIAQQNAKIQRLVWSLLPAHMRERVAIGGRPIAPQASHHGSSASAAARGGSNRSSRKQIIIDTIEHSKRLKAERQDAEIWEDVEREEKRRQEEREDVSRRHLDQHSNNMLLGGGGDGVSSFATGYTHTDDYGNASPPRAAIPLSSSATSTSAPPLSHKERVLSLQRKSQLFRELTAGANSTGTTSTSSENSTKSLHDSPSPPLPPPSNQNSMTTAMDNVAAIPFSRVVVEDIPTFTVDEVSRVAVPSNSSAADAAATGGGGGGLLQQPPTTSTAGFLNVGGVTAAATTASSGSSRVSGLTPRGDTRVTAAGRSYSPLAVDYASRRSYERATEYEERLALEVVYSAGGDGGKFLQPARLGDEREASPGSGSDAENGGGEAHGGAQTKLVPLSQQVGARLIPVHTARDLKKQMLEERQNEKSAADRLLQSVSIRHQTRRGDDGQLGQSLRVSMRQPTIRFDDELEVAETASNDDDDDSADDDGVRGGRHRRSQQQNHSHPPRRHQKNDGGGSDGGTESPSLWSSASVAGSPQFSPVASPTSKAHAVSLVKQQQLLPPPPSDVSRATQLSVSHVIDYSGAGGLRQRVLEDNLTEKILSSKHPYLSLDIGMDHEGQQQSHTSSRGQQHHQHNKPHHYHHHQRVNSATPRDDSGGDESQHVAQWDNNHGKPTNSTANSMMMGAHHGAHHKAAQGFVDRWTYASSTSQQSHHYPPTSGGRQQQHPALPSTSLMLTHISSGTHAPGGGGEEGQVTPKSSARHSNGGHYHHHPHHVSSPLSHRGGGGGSGSSSKPSELTATGSREIRPETPPAPKSPTTPVPHRVNAGGGRRRRLSVECSMEVRYSSTTTDGRRKHNGGGGSQAASSKTLIMSSPSRKHRSSVVVVNLAKDALGQYDRKEKAKGLRLVCAPFIDAAVGGNIINGNNTTQQQQQQVTESAAMKRGSGIDTLIAEPPQHHNNNAEERAGTPPALVTDGTLWTSELLKKDEKPGVLMNLANIGYGGGRPPSGQSNSNEGPFQAARLPLAATRRMSSADSGDPRVPESDRRRSSADIGRRLSSATLAGKGGKNLVRLPRPASSSLSYVDKFGRPVNLETFIPPKELSVRTCVLDASPQVAVQDRVALALQRLAPEPLPLPPSFLTHPSPSRSNNDSPPHPRRRPDSALFSSAAEQVHEQLHRAHRQHRAEALGGSAMVRRWMEFQTMRPEDRVRAGLPTVYTNRPVTAPLPNDGGEEVPRVKVPTMQQQPQRRNEANHGEPTHQQRRPFGAKEMQSMFARKRPNSSQATSLSSSTLVLARLPGEPCRQLL